MFSILISYGKQRYRFEIEHHRNVPIGELAKQAIPELVSYFIDRAHLTARSEFKIVWLPSENGCRVGRSRQIRRKAGKRGERRNRRRGGRNRCGRGVQEEEKEEKEEESWCVAWLHVGVYPRLLKFPDNRVSPSDYTHLKPLRTVSTIQSRYCLRRNIIRHTFVSCGAALSL